MYATLITLHVIAALIWVGGVAFIGLALMPALRGMDPKTRMAAIRGAGRRFRYIGWSALLVLVVTGLMMIHRWGIFETGLLSHKLLTMKLVFVLLMLMCSGLHDWYLGPRIAAAVRAGEDPGPARAWSGRLGRLTMLLSLAIVILAVLLARPALAHQLWGPS